MGKLKCNSINNEYFFGPLRGTNSFPRCHDEGEVSYLETILSATLFHLFLPRVSHVR